MALNANSTLIPSKGTALVDRSPGLNATFPDLSKFDPADPKTYTGWDLFGHMSRENLPALDKDGGDQDQKGSWWDPSLRSVSEPTTLSYTMNGLQVDVDTLQTAWPSGRVTENGVFSVFGDETAKIRIAFIVIDANGPFALELCNTETSIGDMPEFDVEEFFEIQVGGSLLSSPVDGARLRFHKDGLTTTDNGRQAATPGQ